MTPALRAVARQKVHPRGLVAGTGALGPALVKLLQPMVIARSEQSSTSASVAPIGNSNGCIYFHTTDGATGPRAGRQPRRGSGGAAASCRA
jgi:hypothetical protein